jgi:aspartate kinase
MGIIVQKYGGTSVADDASRQCLARKVRQAREAGDQVALVVSAMGRRGAPFATDTLIDALRGFEEKADPMGYALLVSCGETISAALVSAFLRSQGLPAVPMTAYTAGIRAEGPYDNASPTEVDARAVRAVLDAGRIPVVTGFQAINRQGEIVTLGRGGSDTSAVAVGVALKADYVDIYTDVPGVAKADPRCVDPVEYLDFLDYDAMFRLAKYGARVLHDRSAILAKLGGALLRIRSTRDEGRGTLVGPRGHMGREGRFHGVPDFFGLASAPLNEREDLVTALFAPGKGGRALGLVPGLAERHGLGVVPAPEEDLVCLSCDKARTRPVMEGVYQELQRHCA